jgi:hypothetical protein
VPLSRLTPDPTPHSPASSGFRANRNSSSSAVAALGKRSTLSGVETILLRRDAVRFAVMETALRVLVAVILMQWRAGA